MPRFETVVDEALEERIIRLASSDKSAPKIWDVLSDELDYPPSERTIRRIVERRKADVVARATRDLNVLPRQSVPEPRATVRQKQRASRRAKSPGESYEAVHHAEPLPVFPGAGPKAELPADEQGFNARQKAGLPAMPPEETTEEYLRAQGRRMYKQGEAVLDESGFHAAPGWRIEDYAAELYRRTGRYPTEALLALAVAG
jgi:hypothetical protein